MVALLTAYAVYAAIEAEATSDSIAPAKIRLNIVFLSGLADLLDCCARLVMGLLWPRAYATVDLAARHSALWASAAWTSPRKRGCGRLAGI